MEKIITGGKLVTESEIFEADILIRDEKIAAIGQELAVCEGMEIINAKRQTRIAGWG